MAPKPQQMQSRNDSVKTSNSRRLPSAMAVLLRPVARGNDVGPARLAARAARMRAPPRVSPFMGSSTTSMGSLRSVTFIASSNSFSRSRPLMNLRDGATEPCVGSPSVMSMIWSGSDSAYASTASHSRDWCRPPA